MTNRHTLTLLALATIAAGFSAPASQADTVAVTLSTSTGTPGSNGLEFSEGYRFNVDAALTVTELGKFDVLGDGLEADAIVALYNWNTGAKITEATILAGTPTEETGSFDSHFVDIPDVVLTSGTDYVLAVETKAFDATYDATGGTLSTFAPGINFVEGLATGVGTPAMPATADATTFPIAFAGDSYFGPNFKVAEDLPQFNIDVDRDSGALTLSFVNVDPFAILGYSIKSGVGALAPEQWKSINDNYDADGPNMVDGGAMNGTVDPDDNWTELSASNTDLSEFEFDGGDGATISDLQTIDLGTGVWIQNPTEDLRVEVKLADGSSLFPRIRFSGNDGNAFESGDLNFDGTINGLDWSIFRDGNQAALSGLSRAEAYQMGDLDGDGDNDVFDFDYFRNAYDNVLGTGSLDALIAAVPEPSSGLLLLVGFLLAACSRRNTAGLCRALVASPPSMRPTSRRVRPAVDENQYDIHTRKIPAMFHIAGPFSMALAFTVVQALTISTATAQSIPAVTLDSSMGTPGSNGLEFSEGYRFNVDAALTVTELGKFDIVGDGLEADALVALFNWDTGAKIVEATILAGTPTEETGSFDTHFVDIPDLVLAPGTDYLLAVETGPFDATYDASNVTFISTFAPGVNFVEGRFTPVGSPAMPATADGFTGSFPGDSYFGPNFKIDVEPPPNLTLQVATNTGEMTLLNDTDTVFDINFYQLSSALDSLDAANWNSLEHQDLPGFPVGDGTGNGWEESGGVGSHALAEGFLQGNSTLNPSDSINLGKGYDVGVDARDLVFTFRTGSGEIFDGFIDYVTALGVPGDYNGSGTVDSADYTIFRDNLGTSFQLLNEGAGITPGQVTTEDYDFWKMSFGNSGNGIASGTAVPEPSSLTLLLLGLVIALRWPLMISIRPATIRAAAVLIAAWVIASSNAEAAVSNDREYTFGEDGFEGPSQGTVIGSNNTSPLPAGNTADSTGPTGAFLDLDQSGSPTYQDVGPGGLARPGVSGTEFGARFDGVDDRLTGIPLNRPDDIDLVLPNYPINYDGITSRGAQMWVYPSAAKIGAAAQTILLDTQIMGGPQISADGKWTQANSGHSTGETGAVPADVAVVGDTWYHVMHHVYNQDDPAAPHLVSGGGGTNHRSIVYVNGVAVSANGDDLPAGADLTAGGYSGNLVVGAEDDGLGGFTNHFQGVIDNLAMYVFGVNDAGTYFGTFGLFADNAWIAKEIIDTIPGGVLLPGDVNKDGAVDSGDISPFVAGWGSERVMVGAHSTLTVGDWNTWDNGDMNHDGVTGLDDAVILHDALVAATGSGLNFSLLTGAGVPEPSSGLLVLIAALGIGSIGRSRKCPLASIKDMGLLGPCHKTQSNRGGRIR